MQTYYSIIQEFEEGETNKSLILAEKYPPMARTLFGAMTENIYGTNKAVSLWNTPNPLTTYKIGINEQVLPEIRKWRIE